MITAGVLAGLLMLVGAAAVGMFWALPKVRGLLRDVREMRAAVEEMRSLVVHLVQTVRAPALLPDPPTPFAAGDWEQIGGDGLGWQGDEFYKVRSIVCDGGQLYASLTGPRQDGPQGEVWCLSEGNWRCIGGNDDRAWPASPAFVDQLAMHQGVLYAGASHGLWRWKDGAWMLVEGSAGADAGIYAFADGPEGLALSFWGRPGVALLRDGRMERLPGPEGGWGEEARTVYSLCYFRGQLYAATGTGRLRGEGGMVFRYDGRTWERIGGCGIRGSWSVPAVPFVLSLRVFGNRLIATLSRPSDLPAAASNVWTFDGETWLPVGVGHTPALMASSLIMNDAIVYHGRLVVATGDSSHRDARVWSLEAGQRWQDISGTALARPLDRYPGGAWIYCLATDGISLYAGTAGHQGAARIFRFRPRVTEEL